MSRPDGFADGALVFLPLGGAGEIGANLNLYGYDGKWLMVDLGVTFGEQGHPGLDVVMPDPGFIESRREDLVGLVLTHAHEDHFGAVQYLWPDLRCPVYAGPFTAALLRRKLLEGGFNPDLPLTVVRAGERHAIGPFDVELIRVTHSIVEPTSLVIRTPLGTVLHSGDWKLDPDPLIGETADEAAFRRVGEEGVLALVGDSTNAMVPGHSGSEAEARRGLIECVGRYENRVAIASFASNVARLETVARVAQATGRNAALVGRSLWRIYETARDVGYLHDLPPFLSDREARDLPRHRVLMAVTGSQGEPGAALARIAEGSHPQIDLDPGDTVIFSSRMIPGNEVAIQRVQNGLTRRGIELVTGLEDTVHVSGHPAQAELESLYQWVRPQLCLPVHGEPRHQRAHAELAKRCQVPRVIVPQNGQIIHLAPGEPGLADEVPGGRLAVDGEDILPLDSPVLRERHRMLFEGAATVILLFDPDDRLREPPRLSIYGIVDEDEDADLLAAFAGAVEAAVDALPDDARGDDATVREVARRALRRAVRQDRGKRPVTQVQILRL